MINSPTCLVISRAGLDRSKEALFKVRHIDGIAPNVVNITSSIALNKIAQVLLGTCNNNTLTQWVIRPTSPTLSDITSVCLHDSS